MTWLRNWLGSKWRSQETNELAKAYYSTFSTVYGRMVLQDLFDRVYCQVYEGTDPVVAAMHNAKRSVVHDILWNMQMGELGPRPFTVIQGGLSNGDADTGHLYPGSPSLN